MEVYRSIVIGGILALAISGCSSDRQQVLQQTSPANISAVSHSAAKPSSKPTPTQLAQSLSSTETQPNGEQTEQQKAVQVIRSYYDAINNNTIFPKQCNNKLESLRNVL